MGKTYWMRREELTAHLPVLAAYRHIMLAGKENDVIAFCHGCMKQSVFRKTLLHLFSDASIAFSIILAARKSTQA